MKVGIVSESRCYHKDRLYLTLTDSPGSLGYRLTAPVSFGLLLLVTRFFEGGQFWYRRHYGLATSMA